MARKSHSWLGPTGVLVAVLGLLLTSLTMPAQAAGTDPDAVSQQIRFTTTDRVSIQTTLTGRAPMVERPVVVEFSPYGNASGTFDPGPDYNKLLVQIRGTGGSDGRFDALGPRTQADVAEVLGWACHQPWSNGNLGINGFSASAITIYNSLHLPLPCVRTAVLKSGTFELYRDLLSPGGVNNLLPGAGVLGLIGAPALAQGPDRLMRNPLSSTGVLQGLVGTGLADLAHPTQDAWWRERGFRGDVNHLPILMVDGFFDVESRGAFQAYQALKADGSHLLVTGAHDGAPAGTDGGSGDMKAWFDHYLRGVDNHVTEKPAAQLRLSDGDREDYLAGDYVDYDASDWPVPGTRWESLALSATRSGSAHSLNDGSLEPDDAPAGPGAVQSYAALPSLPTSVDPPNTAILGGFGLNAVANGFPPLTQLDAVEPLALSYTTRPFINDVLAAGPASLELRLASTSPETAIWAVLSDVAPDGSSHPLTAGRLLSSYPDIDRSRSLVVNGDVVQPYGDFSHKSRAAPGHARNYQVELWPVGNRFKAGHRLRLDLVGASLASLPTLPGVNQVQVGGDSGSRLLFPVLPTRPQTRH